MPQIVPIQMTPIIHGHSYAFFVRRTTEGGGSEKLQKSNHMNKRYFNSFFVCARLFVYYYEAFHIES